MYATIGAMDTQQVVIAVPDLDEALRYFVDALGFEVDRIWPADKPRVAHLIGQGHALELRLHGIAQPLSTELPWATPSLEIHRRRDAQWGRGRAGMQYCDLIPSRIGGRVIASHIRIPGSGPVDDWVHYHEVDFQMIFCRRGQVTVVYEDQGPPMVLEAGDGVLQPPTIRHRVLESSDDLEVIEIGSPAAHVTVSDRQCDLPTPTVRPSRTFGGQTFVLSRAHEGWTPQGDLEVRDLGFGVATEGLADAQVIRGTGRLTLAHLGGLLFLFVLEGRVELSGATLETGDCASFTQAVEGQCRGEFLAVSLRKP